ncbi:hypothetical protein [Nocardioides sp. cx-173]|uniref:hypothetical protein n=1 Tax=Nocardioides sp. cx-173 TaxID=2898796 RepID=UPI001E331C93|nr:hypothetical protein [Nocardioides sp. cx-173]MCD4524804.1 hypothetical protein [Nocardioides sp. cx-173]UGB43310.1 hypothetical protein LQ940_07220 [Nocardioides sp. cx-173]
MTAPTSQIRALPIIGGLALGMVACWLWIAVALIVGFGAAYGSDSEAPAILALAVAAVPVVVGIVLLLRPRTRQLGAGFLMGISIGFIAGAGVCASMFFPGTF